MTIVGTTPLLVNKFSEKAKQQIEDKQTGVAKAKKEFRDPKAEYEASMYTFKNGKKTCYGIPAGGVKTAAVTACKFIDGIAQTFARGAFHIIPAKGSANLVEITGTPQMDESFVKIGPFGRKVAMPRYRARFDEWECSFDVVYNPNVISAEQIANLYENAGFAVGLCEWRPEKNGSLGMFELKR